MFDTRAVVRLPLFRKEADYEALDRLFGPPKR